ncbi:MAG: NUDIX domain-containing protein [Cyanobacteria bacterium P01_C01_bin.89]
MAKSQLPVSQDAAFGIVPIYLPPGGTLDDAEYLLIQHNAGHWAFPKGHAENDEAPLESACREFTEETGVKEFNVLETVSFNEKYEIRRTARIIHKVVTYYPAFLDKVKVTIQEEEIADYRWQTYADAKKLITYENSRSLIQKVYDHLKAHPESLPTN